jgi:xylulokinase
MGVEAILALDVGTSGCRAEILAFAGRSLGRHYQEYGLSSPEPGAAEQDPSQWWKAAVNCTRLARQACPEPVRLVAVGLSVQGHTWVPVDAQLRPLRPALTWLDSRAAPQARALLEQHGADFWGRAAGKLPGPWHLLPQLLWLREAEPGVCEQAERYMFAQDWLTARLTGQAVADYTQCATSLLLDLGSSSWSEGLLEQYGVLLAKLPQVQPAGTALGPVTAEAAQALGLEPTAVVAVGAQDQKCAALAAGLDATTATVSLGTAIAIEAPIPAPRFDPALGAIPCFPWLWRGQWVLEAPMTTGGGAFRWLRDVLADSPATTFESLIAAAEAVPPGAEGVCFLPYLAGAGAPCWQPDATATFTGMTLRTGRGHLTRAVLEGVACDIHENLQCMKRLGCRLERLRLFGGGARSPLWPRIIAATTGLPTETCAEAEAATRGAAMLAAMALGAEPAAFALQTRPVEVPDGWPEAYVEVRAAYSRARQQHGL